MSDRDQNVDRLLREAMAGPVRAESADCLDIETLAFWSEGSLRADERGRAEAHAATCTRCQSMLAAMIRTEPVVAVASPSPFRTWLMTLGPVLGAAAAVALWVAIDRPVQQRGPADTMARVEGPSASSAVQEKTDTKEREAAAAPSPKGAPAESAAPSGEVRSSSRAREADKNFADAAERKRSAVSAPTLLDRLADAKTKSISGYGGRAPRAEASDNTRIVGSLPAVTPPPPPPAAPEPQRQDRVQARQAQGQSNEGVNQPLNQAPSPSQQNATQNYTPLSAAQPNQQAAEERRASESAAPPPPVTITTASQPARDNFGRSGRGQAVGGAAGARGIGVEPAGPALSTFDVPTSNPSTRYRALFGRTLQRSTDGGTTWTTVRMLAPPAVIVAGVAPSPTVCWLAGTGGIVL